MKKFLLTSTVIILGLSIYIITSSIEDVEVKVTEKVGKSNDVTYQSVTPDYEWVIEFDKGINETLLNNETLYVTDEKNNIVPVSFKKENNTTVRVLPPKEGYNQGTRYILNINKNLDSEKSEEYNPEETYERNFKVEVNV